MSRVAGLLIGVFAAWLGLTPARADNRVALVIGVSLETRTSSLGA